MEIRTLPIEQINPAPYNPRKDLRPGDPEYEKLKKSILEFDYVDPIIWNEQTGRVVGGHQRLKILRELGRQQVEVSVVNLPEDKEKALNLALNKTGGEWDQSMLKDLLEELNTGAFDIEITGFDEEEIEDLMTQFQIPNEVVEDDFDAEAEAEKITEPVTKRGDIWLLGRHRLMCGDALVITDVEKLMAGEQANLVITDPPYNVDYTGGTKDALKIKNDKMSEADFYKFLLEAFTNMFLVADDGAPVYIFHADSEGLNFRRAMIDAGWKLAQCCIWVKQSMVMGRQDYQWQHEPVLYGWKPTGAHRWHSDRCQTTVWHFDRPMSSKEHPTMKPVALVAYPIQNSSVRNCILFDPFGGSGSTLIAAEQLDRICRTMEIDPVYCEVIIKRWEQYTGQKAERL